MCRESEPKACSHYSINDDLQFVWPCDGATTPSLRVAIKLEVSPRCLVICLADFQHGPRVLLTKTAIHLLPKWCTVGYHCQMHALLELL